MEKVDFKVEFKHLYSSRSGEFTQVEVPELTFVMVDGHGNPNTSVEYAAAVEALYTISYTLKFMSQRALGRDYKVPPLEGLWWSKDMRDFERGDKDRWLWTAMILLPEWITQEQFTEGVDAAATRKPGINLTRVRRGSFTEGLSVQTLFVGPYDDEAPTIAELHNSYLPARGLRENGKHHEIYLNDPRRTSPDRWRTIIRQPVLAI